MRIQSILVGLVALTTTVAAVDRPKFYFPKHVKRQVFNNTISSNTPSETSSESLIATELVSVLLPVVATTSEPEVVMTVVNTVVIDNGKTTTLPAPIPSAEPTTPSVPSAEPTPPSIPSAELTPSIPATEPTPLSVPSAEPIPPSIPSIPSTEPSPSSIPSIPSTEPSPPSIPSAEPTSPLLSTSSEEGEKQVGSSAGVPDLIITPTSPAKTSTAASEDGLSTQPSSTETSSEKQITFAPSGVITESDEPTPTSVVKTGEIEKSTGVPLFGSAIGTGATTAKPTSADAEESAITSATPTVVESEDILQSSTVIAISTTENDPATTVVPSLTTNSGITGDFSTGVITNSPESTESSIIAEPPIIEPSTIFPDNNSTALPDDPIIESSTIEPSPTSESVFPNKTTSHSPISTSSEAEAETTVFVPVIPVTEAESLTIVPISSTTLPSVSSVKSFLVDTSTSLDQPETAVIPESTTSGTTPKTTLDPTFPFVTKSTAQPSDVFSEEPTTVFPSEQPTTDVPVTEKPSQTTPTEVSSKPTPGLSSSEVVPSVTVPSEVSPTTSALETLSETITITEPDPDPGTQPTDTTVYRPTDISITSEPTADPTITNEPIQSSDVLTESSVIPTVTGEPIQSSDVLTESTAIPTITGEPIQSSDVLPEPTANVTLIPSETDSGISFTPAVTLSSEPTVLPSATENSTLIPILPLPTETDSKSSGLETATEAPSATGTASQSSVASVSLVTDEPPAVTPTDIAPTFTPKPVVVTDAPPDYVPSKVETYVPPTQTKSAPTVMPTGLPTDMPRMVSPSGGVPEQAPEDDMVMIQIGFDQALNYEFVVGNSKSPTQIFTFLPMGISYGLGIPREQVVMHSIQPFDTQSTLGYITTLAVAWIPAASLEKLGMVIRTPSSPLYHYDPTNPSAGSVDTITSHINSAIPFIAGGNLDGVPASKNGDDGKPGSGKGSKSDGGVFGSDGAAEDQPASVKGMTAGIATGAVVAAAAYGATMFFLARRYKKRKLAHRRSRSVEGPEMMGPGSPGLMGGAMMSGGRMTPATAVGSERYSRGSGQTGSSGARTAKISAPMAAENSLGWN